MPADVYDATNYRDASVPADTPLGSYIAPRRFGKRMLGFGVNALPTEYATIQDAAKLANKRRADVLQMDYEGTFDPVTLVEAVTQMRCAGAPRVCLYAVGGSWGYVSYHDPARFADDVARLVPVLRRVDLVCPDAYLRSTQPVSVDQFTWDMQYLASTYTPMGLTVRPEVMPWVQDGTEQMNVYLGDDIWRHVVRTCVELFGGLTVWGGVYLSPEGWRMRQWDAKAAWLRILREETGLN